MVNNSEKNEANENAANIYTFLKKVVQFGVKCTKNTYLTHY